MAGKFDNVEYSLRQLLDDQSTPRSVREKITAMLAYLKQPVDDSEKVSRSLATLEDLSGDINIPPFIRTQLYGIAGMLEAITI